MKISLPQLVVSEFAALLVAEGGFFELLTAAWTGYSPSHSLTNSRIFNTNSNYNNADDCSNLSRLKATIAIHINRYNYRTKMSGNAGVAPTHPRMRRRANCLL